MEKLSQGVERSFSYPSDDNEPKKSNKPSVTRTSSSPIYKWPSLVPRRRSSLQRADPVSIVQTKLMKNIERNLENGSYNDKDFRLFIRCYAMVKIYFNKNRRKIKATVSMIKDVLKWRQKEGITQSMYLNMPNQLFDSRLFLISRTNGLKNQRIFVRLKYWPEKRNVQSVVEKLIYSCIFKVEEENVFDSEDTGFEMICDLSEITVSNPATRWFCSFLKNYFEYFPVTMKSCTFVNYSWQIKMFLKTSLVLSVAKYRKKIIFDPSRVLSSSLSSDDFHSKLIIDLDYVEDDAKKMNMTLESLASNSFGKELHLFYDIKDFIEIYGNEEKIKEPKSKKIVNFSDTLEHVS